MPELTPDMIGAHIQVMRSVCRLQYEQTQAHIKDPTRPQVIDPHYGIAALAMHRELSRLGRAGALYEPAVESFRSQYIRGFPLNPYIAPNLFARGLHDYALTHDPERLHYPYAFGISEREAVHNWQNLMYEALADPDRQFRQTINYRTINSTVRERGRSMELIASLFGERLRGKTGFDVGSNLNFLAKGLTNPDLHTALGWELADEFGKADHELTSRMLGKLLLQQPLVGAYLGVDRETFGPNGDATRVAREVEWVIHCSVTPSEMVAHPDLFDNLRYHYSQPAPLAYQTTANFLECTPDNFPPPGFLEKIGASSSEHEPFKFGFATAFTTAYLLDDKGRRQLIQNMHDFTADDALLFIQDFAEPGGSDATAEPLFNITFADNIYDKPWNYRLMAYDKLNPQAGWQTLIVNETGRCRRARVAGGRIAIGKTLLGLKSIRDRLNDPRLVAP